MSKLPQVKRTESRNPRTLDLDQLPVPDLVRRLHEETVGVWTAVEAALPKIAAVVEAIVDRISRGGRLIYVGAGSSGRLGVLDAAECPPTFSVDSGMVIGIIAGGQDAVVTSVEGAEDAPEAGEADLRAINLSPSDVVVGIAASGTTPYVLRGLNYAREIGALRVAVFNNPGALMDAESDISILADTGPEPLTGSTRMNAGTSQKLILNLISTSVMVRMGKVYENLMVDVRATNAKLRKRAIGIVREVTGADDEACEAALHTADGQVKTAILMLVRGVSANEARTLLDKVGGSLRKAL